jgi:hypothetical protein
MSEYDSPENIQNRGFLIFLSFSQNVDKMKIGVDALFPDLKC